MIGRMVFMNIWTMVSGLIALYILVFLAAVAGSVLFGCAVYNDAKSKWNDNATMWGVLVGILGLIPGIHPRIPTSIAHMTAFRLILDFASL